MIRKTERPDEDFAEEIRSHLRLEADQRIAEGATPEEAMKAAQRAFGNVTRSREGFYESHRRIWLENLLKDFLYAFRQMRRSPVSTVTIVASLALGIGACTAVFSILSPLLLKPLPFEDPQRLVWIANDGGNGMSGVTSRVATLRDFRDRSQSFDGLTGYFAFFEQGSYNLTGSGEPVRLIGVPVAHDFLQVIGVPPVLGRSFVEEEGRFGGPNAVVLSHAFWTRQYGADPSVVSSTISLNGEQAEVVGILPPSFDFASIFAPHTRVDFLTTFPISDEMDRRGNTLSIIGRLAPGATLASAQADLDQIILGIQESDPTRPSVGAIATGVQDKISGPFRSAFLLLAAAAGAVMLIVCVNLSNLLLTKGTQRSKEMAVRSALGAARFRLVRQMVIESLTLALIGAALGQVLAMAATHFVARADGLDIPLLNQIAVDGRAMLFCTSLALAVGVVVGIVPALRVSSGHEAAAFSGSGRGMSASRDSTRLREGLVIAEIALACILLVFGGLLLKSFQNLLDVDLGFRAEEVVAWQIQTTRPFDNLADLNAFYGEVVDSVQSIPGVASVGLTDAAPLGRNRGWPLYAPGLDYNGDRAITTFPHVVDSQYLPTMEIPLLAGRHFTPQDDRDRDRVVILNETAAKAVYHGEEVLGRKVRVGPDVECEVIGVVKDIRHRSLALGAGPELYLPFTQSGDFRTLDMVVRSSIPVSSLAKSVQRAIHAIDPAMPTGDYLTLDSLVQRSVSPRRFTLQLLGAFAAVALALAALGIYGVLSHAVTERIPEIGIRMALGETRGQVLQRIVGKTLLLAIIGLALGATGSFLVTKWVSALLYDTTPSDPTTFLITATVLLLVAALAGFLPALRASRVEAASVLRQS
ncbi:MAG: ABC transporter permease [Deltaproteobacteria bacterium]|nr:ABC transporter permease [Deltaproteobacteria bacterium]